MIKRYINWLFSYLDYKKFIKNNIIHLNNFQKNASLDTIVLIQPWDFNIVPWYSITFYIILINCNIKCKLLIDDLNFYNNKDLKFQLFLIKKITKFFNKNDVIFLSEFKGSTYTADLDINFIEKLAYANTVQYFRGNIKDPDFHKTKTVIFEGLCQTSDYIFNFISKHQSCKYLIPGGIYGNSGLFVQYLKKNQTNFVTFDSGEHIFLSSINGVASQLADIKLSIDLLKKDINIFNKIEEQVLIDIEKRKRGTHFLNIQKTPLENKVFSNIGFLIPLNIFWDGAALLIDNYYENYYDWLMSTIDTILNNCDEFITIRQHPDERHWWGIALFNFKKNIEEKFNKNPRIKFIDKNQEINTYDLLYHSKGVICFSSTIAIESYILGKKVAVGSNCYYSNYDFVNKINSSEDLLNFINSQEYTYNKNAYIDAIYLYYLGQMCNWNETYFTPNFEDFKIWSKYKIEDLILAKGVDSIISSYVNLTPISFYNHLKKSIND